MTQEHPAEGERRAMTATKCPECNGPMAHRSGCLECLSCGFAFCTS
ncbi:MAG: hypothetical protein QW505_03155 [Thermoplasmata archaeon]